MHDALLRIGVFAALVVHGLWRGTRPTVASVAAALAALLLLWSFLRAFKANRGALDSSKAASSAVEVWPRRASLLWMAATGALFLLWSKDFIASSSVRVGERTYYSLFDDAMISMRYAWNLTHGLGLTWNPGERVEGFTNPLMVFVMSLATAVFDKSDAVLAVHVFGVVFMLACAYLTSRVADRVFADETPGARAAAAGIAFALTLLYYPLVYWSQMGMETGLLAVLVTTAVWVVLEHRSTTRTVWLFPVLLGLMTWTRPDALLQAGILWAFRAWQLREPGRRRTLVSETIPFIAFLLISMLARRLYYGEWLPNTYVLKMTRFPLSLRLENSRHFIGEFFKEVRIPTVLALVGLLLSRRLPQLLITLLFASAVLYQTWVGGDPWLYWRIMAPYVPLLLVGAAFGASAIARALLVVWSRARDRAERPDGGVFDTGAIATAAAAFVIMTATERFVPQMVFSEPPYLVRNNQRNVKTGLALARICTPEAVAGVFWAGTIPYYSGTRAVDFLGKADKRIARLDVDPRLGFGGMKSVPGHNKYDLRYSIGEIKPDYVQDARWGHDDMRAFVRKHYTQINGMWLLNGSPRIRWDLLSPGGTGSKAP